MKIVIDFSGYYYKNKFIIKEFCLFRIQHLTIIPGRTIITKDLITSISSRPQNESYQKFIDKFGINNTHSSYTLNRLRQKLKVIIHRSNNIYVRNRQQLSKLISFINDNRYGCKEVKLMSDLGFNDSYELTETNCPYHSNQSNNYCAHDNARFMTYWLRQRKVDKIQLRTNMQLVINFSGYYDHRNKFKIKELSIHGLNDDGYIVYHKLYVTKPAYNLSSFMNEYVKNKFNDIYYDNFGIKYEDGNRELLHTHKKISEIILNNDVKIIYVKNLDYFNLLRKIVANIEQFVVICLEDYYYIDTYDIWSNCGYHTHEDSNKNICVDSSGINMVNWILTNKFYKSEVRDRFYKIKLTDDIDDELVKKFIIDDNHELPLLNSDDLELF
ncbi:uncharacterized protein LOC130675451 [Microplitis mediator]|uniref:uncharacterized protein LOC130675451 n=1 Tax=Microplitis mediator TaxID=375433 RepID=UPI002555A86E|nr:uncharacterized protein LOC130675451 [Microplitis mediator]